MKIADKLLLALVKDPIGAGLLGGEVRVYSESGEGILPCAFLFSDGASFHASEFGRPVRVWMAVVGLAAAGRNGAWVVCGGLALAVVSALGTFSVLSNFFGPALFGPVLSGTVLFDTLSTDGMDASSSVENAAVLFGCAGYALLSRVLLKAGLGSRVSTILLDRGLSAHERLDLLAGGRR